MGTFAHVRSSAPWLLGLLSLVSLPAVAEEPPQSGEEILAAQPTELVERLNDEKIIVMQEVREKGALSGGLILGFVLFEKPLAQVYDLLSQTERQAEFRPEVTRIETVDRYESGHLDEHHLKIIFRRYSYRLHYSLEPETNRISWTLADGYDNDLEQLGGFWELFPLGPNRTLGRFGNQVSVGPAVPGFLQDWITRKNLPRAMQRVRAWVDSDGQVRP